MTQPAAVPAPAPIVPEQAHVDALASSEGFVSFRFAMYEGAIIAEFVRTDGVPIAFSEVGLERRLAGLSRAKKPHAFTEYVLAEMQAKTAGSAAK